MLARIINQICERFAGKLPALVGSRQLAPIAIVPNSNSGPWSIQEIFGGFVWATPKRRTPLRKIWANKYGNDNWRFGTKLFKPKRNIITCSECGDFHEWHVICRTCFKKVHEESKQIIDGIRNAWGRGTIDKEIQVLYQGETASSVGQQKRIVELERPRPLWFASNLSQKSANPAKHITGPAIESDNLTIREKQENS